MRYIAGFIMAASLIITGPNVWAGVPTHTWTADTDFDQGTLENVNHNSPNNDQLQLNPGISVTLPFIWVANSDEGTISKINTDTGQELGRYRTGPGGDNPSRTTVDLNGDVWVGNRNSASATKVALIPQDRNGDGIINTSGDKNNNGMIDPGEVVDIKPWGTDEAVIVRVSAPGGTRAVAVDASNNVWIGGTEGGGVDPYYMRYYDGATGAYLNKKVWVGRACYGALIDGNGTLWVSNDGSNTLTRINNPTADGAAAQIINPGTGWVYGLGIDTEGFIYCSGWTNNRFRKYNPATSTWVYDIATGKSGGRGVCVGLDGTVWVAHSYSNQVTRHNPANGAIIATVNVGNHPTGVAVDNNGKIWVTNYYGNSIQRIDPATNSVDFTQGGHPGPYNYSDMTGAISQSITTKNGKWSDVFDSGCDYAHWGTVTWNSSEPAGTSINISIRVAGTEAGLSSATWIPVSNGVEFSPAAAGRFVEIKAEFTIVSGTVSPILNDLTIKGAETIISVYEAALCGKINMYCYPWNGMQYTPISSDPSDPSANTPLPSWTGFYLVVNDDVDLLIPKASAPAGSSTLSVDPERWYLFTVPFIPTNGDIFANFGDDIDGMYETSWRVSKWFYDIPRYRHYTGPDPAYPALLPGRGFWMYHINSSAKTLDLEGLAVNPAGEYYELKLPVMGSTSWHMSGNPYLYDIFWKNCKVRIPMTNALPLAKVAASRIESWFVGLQLQSIDGKSLDTYNRAGIVMTPGVNATVLNAVDLLPPGSYIRLALKDPANTDRGALAYDYREAGKMEYTWTIELTTTYSSISTRFSVTDLAKVPEGYMFTLKDNASGEAIPLTTDMTVPVTLSSTAPRTFTLTATAIQKPIGVEERIPLAFGIAGVKPNPFNPSTSITFNMEREGNAAVKIYSASGQLVATLVNSKMGAGMHTATWNARGHASGVYLAVVETKGKIDTRKITLMK